MNERACTRAVSSTTRLVVTVMLLLSLTGGLSQASTPKIQLQSRPVQEVSADVAVSLDVAAHVSSQTGIAVCPATAGNRIYLPMVARGYSGGASYASVPLPVGGQPANRPTGLRAVSSPDNGSLALRVAYIHDADSATVGAFRSLLDARKFETYLLPLNDVPGADFSGCDLILVGADTGAWGDVAVRTAVLDASLPVGALGDGGFSFLSTAGLLSGLASGSDSATTVVAVPRGRQAYLFPNNIPLAGDDSIQLYATAGSVWWLDAGAPLSNGIEIGRLPGTTRHAILQLGRRFLVWGFSGGPASMTQAGQDLFVNVLAFQGQGLRVPLRSRQFAPQPGVEQAFLDGLDSTSQSGLHAFVQLRLPPGDPSCVDLANLVPKGVTELHSLHDQTHLAFVSKTFDPNDPLVGACLRWVGRVLPQDKVMPKVLASDFEDWADNGDETVNLLVSFFPDVSEAEAESILASHVVSDTARGLHSWSVVIAKDQIAPLSQSDQVSWVQEGPMPFFSDNDTARQELFVDDIQQADIVGSSIAYNGLDGSGIKVAVMDGRLDNSHPDFSGRVIRNGTHSLSDHGTHVAGIIGADGSSSSGAGGTDFQWRGMAPAVELASFSGSTDDLYDFFEAYYIGVHLSNHSYTQSCMLYDSGQAHVDSIVRGDADLLGVPLPARPYHKSAGNNGTSSQYCSSTGVEGYFSVTGVAKNQTIVGALNPGTGYLLRSSTARGPTYDGRIKPDVMAIGSMKSTVADDFIDDSSRDCDGSGDDYCFPYDTMSGTSMATPATTGIAALVLQEYGLTYGSQTPLPSTVKALLINNATDLVQDPSDPSYSAYAWDDPDTGEPVIYHQGPDYSTGYGVIQARRTVNAVRHKDAIEWNLDADTDVNEYTINLLSDREELRFTLAWDDPAASSTLDEEVSHLVNDLDLVLEDPNGGLHYPWVLDPLTPKSDLTSSGDDPITTADITAAYHAEDHLNNVEQVVVWADDLDPSDWAGTWTVRVSATDLDETPQFYSLVGEWREIALQDVYPLDAGYNLAPDVVILPVRVQNPHASSSPAAGGISADNWEVRVGDSASDTWTDATVEAAYGPVGDLAYVVVRPPSTLSAGILYDIEVTLLDVYQVDQRVSEAYEPIDRATRTDAIFFLAEARAPVDEMIVMDNSGSMGDDGKLDSAKNAARAFADRRQEGDMIGLAYFETSAGTLYNLTLVSASETELEDVKAEIDSMTDLNSTALGSGMLEGKNELEASGDTDHTWSIVLLSDGMENIPPCWDTGPGNPFCEGEASVQADFVPSEGCPDIQVDTVALGPEGASWRSLLEDIASQTCGEAWNATVEESTLQAGGVEYADLAGTTAIPLIFPVSLANTLADIYTSIADGNSHQQRLWEEAGILATGEVISRPVLLEDGLTEATFAVNWPDPGSPIQMKLFRPTGMQVNPADADAQRKVDSTHEVYRMVGPAAGPWLLRLEAQQGEAGGEYLAVVSGNTDVTMLLDLGLPPPERVAGAVMPIYVILVDKGGAITGANVQLSVRRPGGAIDALTMYDDGSHGDGAARDGVYTNEYLIPGPGNYQVKARGQGTAGDGGPFLRHRLRHFRVAFRPRVAYIWDSDSVTAGQYQALLEGNGLPVTLVDMVDVVGTDLSAYRLIVIGPDTGLDATWGDAAIVAHIASSGKPVLGLGDGGYAFFGKLDLDIGYNNGVHRMDAAVLAIDPTDDIWRAPYDVSLGSADPVATVYTGNGSPGVVVNPFEGPPGTRELASRPSSGSTLYWLAQDLGRFLLWGFNLGPMTMTETGKGLFVNVAYYMLQ